MIKKCVRCGEEKDKKEFAKRGNLCKKCKNEFDLRKINGEKICSGCSFEGDESLFVKNKNVCKKCKKEYLQNWNANHKDEISKYQKDYREEHKEEKAAYSKNYNKENKEYKSNYNHGYYENNKEKIAIHDKEYKEKNKDKINTRTREKRKNDSIFKLRHDCSISINKTLKSNNSSKNGRSILKYIEYTILEMNQYLESLFEPWMTWENKGLLWHIDHIIPQSHIFFDSLDHPNFKKAWSLKNLRPLEAKQNMSEGDRIKPDQDIEKMSQEEFETYIDVYIKNYEKMKGIKK